MARRLTAHQALQRMQDIESDCSDGELCYSEAGLPDLLFAKGPNLVVVNV